MKRSLAARAAAAAVAWASIFFTTMAGAAVTVVEYYNATLDHYFISPLADDIDALDSGRIPGWSRTGYEFLALAAGGAGLSPVCRYYIPPEHGNSHFLSASPAECAAVQARIGSDPNYSGYILETAAAFYVALPYAATGACPAGLVPVFRLWNQRADSNHRYTTDATVRDAMLARGYAPEGYGPQGVAMCSPGAMLGDARLTVSGPSPYAPGCDNVVATGASFVNAEVEPMLAVNPADPGNLIAAWQQDRWSNGGARGLRTGYSRDGGRTFAYSQATFSRCSGGNPANGGDYARASDPWVSVGPNGIAYQVAIGFTGANFAAGSTNAVLASRSLDGGATWSPPATLMADGSGAFNDKESVTADPTDARYAYAVWDRLLPNGAGPSWIARTSDGGTTWEPAHVAYTPPNNTQTLNNQVVVLPDGTVVLFFTEFPRSGPPLLRVMRSTDKGQTFGAPITVAASQSIGTRDPKTGQEIRDGGNIGSIAVGKNGKIAVAWQDARFTAGVLDGIAFAHSDDGGLTWSAPVAVNRVLATQALLPAVSIRDDGAYGVLYYDLRNDTANLLTLFADVWLAQSPDGANWTESHLSGPFDLASAPRVEEDSGLGYFLGDYMALQPRGTAFHALYVQSKSDVNDFTDVYESIALNLPPVPATAKAGAAPYAARAAQGGMGAAARAAVARAAARTLARRQVGTPGPAGR